MFFPASPALMKKPSMPAGGCRDYACDGQLTWADGSDFKHPSKNFNTIMDNNSPQCVRLVGS